MRRSLLAYAFLLSFLTAVFLLQWQQGLALQGGLWILLSLGLCAAALSLFPRYRLALPALASLLGIVCACAAVARITLPSPPEHVSRITDRSAVVLTGTVTDEPDRRPSLTHYAVSVERIRTGSGTVRAARGTVLVRDTQGWPRYRYGDRLLVRGTLRKPWTINEFRYDRYLELQGISALVTSAELEQPAAAPGERTGRGGLPLLGALYALKEKFEQRIGQIQPEPHASFLAGLLTGSRRSIPNDVQEDFQVTGLTHILAISGYNVTIILALFGGLLFWLPLRARFLPSLAALLAFTLFTGASASVVRAAIMGALGLLALQTGRKAEVRLLILWTAFVMLLWKPQYLWWDAGFQLSFLAIVGLAETGTLLLPLTRFFPSVLGIRESLTATLSAQVFTLPWILFLFHRVSLVSPIANLLVAPLLPLAMLLGFLSVCVSAVSFPLGQAVGYGAWGVLELILRITHALASLPSASLSASLGLGSLALLYGVFVALLVWKNRPLYPPPPPPGERAG
ncbi:MAG: ComEC/Rec2 family competence protein [Candidatus Peribacteraceae bacterium]|jgi:competence protein ComEC